jgi:hypothetical protein
VGRETLPVARVHDRGDAAAPLKQMIRPNGS